MMLGLSSHRPYHANIGFQLLRLMAPSPGISEPDMGNDVQRSSFRSTVVCRDPEEQLVRIVRLFCSFNEDVKIAIILERIRVNDVELSLVLASGGVLVDQLFVRESSLGKFVEVFHVGLTSRLARIEGVGKDHAELTMGRRIVEVKMGFLERLSMIALGVAQTKEPLLQEVVLLVPERERNVLQTV